MLIFRLVVCIATLLLFAPLAAANSAATLTSREIRNLTALTHLVGRVKYFYPNRHTAKVKWETVLVRVIPAVRRARTDAVLVVTLDSLLHSLAASKVILAKPEMPVVTPLGGPFSSAGPSYFWEHHGLGLDKTGLPVVRLMFRLAGLSYDSRIRHAPAAEIATIFSAEQRYYSAWLTDSVRLSIPLVLSKSDYQRKPRPRCQVGQRVRRLRADDVAHRLTTVILTWNIIQHFYPYRDLLDRARWSAVLPGALQRATQTNTEAGLLLTCRTMLAQLLDRHLSISPKTRTGLHIVPPPWALRFILLDSQVVVRQSPPKLRPELAPGTILTRVNGQPVAALLTELQAGIPAASPAVARQLAAESLLTHLAASAPVATFTLLHAQGQSVDYQVALRQAQGSLYHQPPAVREVEPGIFCLDAARLRYVDFQRALPQLQAAKGLVMDLRRRPTYDFSRVLAHFSADSMLPDSTATPLLRQPDFRGAIFLGSTAQRQPPQLPLLSAPKVFLIGPHTYSYGETIAELVHRYHLGLLLGQSTGGTNGEMNFAALGRAYLLSWTGRRVMARGQPYQGTGIAPNEIVMPTLAQIIQEQDAELLRAIEWLKQQ